MNRWIVSFCMCATVAANATEIEATLKDEVPRNIVSITGALTVFPMAFAGPSVGPAVAVQYERVINDRFAVTIRPSVLYALGTNSQLFHRSLTIGAKWYVGARAPRGFWIAPEMQLVAGIYALDVDDSEIPLLGLVPAATVGYSWLQRWLITSFEVGTSLIRVDTMSSSISPRRIDTWLLGVHLRLTLGFAF